MTDAELKNNIAAIAPWVIDLRRALHRIPERGFAEHKTQALIQHMLRGLNIPFESERTWTIALIEGAHPGPTVALRADIDALPVTEPVGAFSSEHPGMMHACGHDAHTAILLGAARVLSEHRSALHGNVKLLFQPAEETEGGAQPMVAAGALQNPQVDLVYGLHVQPYLPAGTVETRSGALNASTDELLITVRGRSGHAAYPDHGADAILAAAQVVTALHTITGRNVSPLQSAVITIGEMHGGTASNVLCGEVVLHGTIRAATNEVRALLHRRAREAAECAARAMGCEADVRIIEGYCALVNHDAPAKRVLTVAERLLGKEHALVKPEPSMGGEDFGYFIQDVPGAFYHIGSREPDAEAFTSLHTTGFKIDERCLEVGVLMQTALAMDALSSNF